jgi:hypothetical protein
MQVVVAGADDQTLPRAALIATPRTIPPILDAVPSAAVSQVMPVINHTTPPTIATRGDSRKSANSSQPFFSATITTLTVVTVGADGMKGEGLRDVNSERSEGLV